MGRQFLSLDCKSDTWALGDVVQMDGQYSFSIPENASVVAFDGKKYGIDHSHAFVLGGVDANGALLNWAMGVEFQQAASAGGVDL